MFFSAPAPKTYHLIDSPKKLAWLANELKGEIAVDIETNHPTKTEKLPEWFVHRVAGISFAWGREGVSIPWSPANAAYVPLITESEKPYWKDRQDATVAALCSILEADLPKVTHNGKFDVGNLFTLLGIRTANMCWDTMLAHAILDEDRRVCSHALKSDFDKTGRVTKLGMSDVYLDTSASQFKDDLETALLHYDPVFRRYSKVPIDVLYPYACADADYTLSLKHVLKPLLEEENMGWLYDNLIIPLQDTLMKLELHGVPTDLARVAEVRKEQFDIFNKAMAEVQVICGKEFNVASTDQLGKVLFEEMGLTGTKNKRGEWQTDADSIRKLNHPVGVPLLDFRRAQHIYAAYADSIATKVEEVTDNGSIGWVHSTYWMDSVTGRLKCSDPNLTQLPRPENGGEIVKSLFYCPENYRIVFKDFSQVELRVIAHLSGEPEWIAGFHRGDDPHAMMAQKIWKLPGTVKEVKKNFGEYRTKAKAVNFGIAYGQSEYGLSEKLGITVDEAKALIGDYFNAAPVLKNWIDGMHQFAMFQGWVCNIFGRRRHLPDAMIKVPDQSRWPEKEGRPSCYRRGPRTEFLGIQDEDLQRLSNAQWQQIIKLKHWRDPQCAACSVAGSCVVNGEVKHRTGLINRALRQAVNQPVQGSAVDMASLSLVWIGQELKKAELDAHPILHIHDELGVYTHVDHVDAVCKIMDECMTTRLVEFTNFAVPLEVDTAIVRRWSEKGKE